MAKKKPANWYDTENGTERAPPGYTDKRDKITHEDVSHSHDDQAVTWDKKTGLPNKPFIPVTHTEIKI